MVKRALLVLLLLCNLLVAHAHQERRGVLYDKISTLVFDEEIVDVELGSQAYHVKVKGKYLLLRAKNKDVAPTSLFVRYGKKTQHYYVTEIFPDAKAPLQYLIQSGHDKKEVDSHQNVATPFTDTTQEYFAIGVIQHGAKVILNKILHIKNATCIQLFIENKSSIELSLEHWTFEYVTVLRQGFFSKKKKRKLAEPITEPSNIKVPAHSNQYVVFCIPTYVSTEGLEVFLEASNGEHGFRFLIPKKVLLKAKRQNL